MSSSNDRDADGEREAQTFLRELIVAELLSRRGEGPLAPRFASRPRAARGVGQPSRPEREGREGDA